MRSKRTSTGVVTVNLAYGFANNVVVRFGNLLLGVALARLLQPEDFGVYAIALTIQVVLANLADLGMTAYLVRTPDVDRRASTVLTTGTIVGATLALLMAALAGPIARGFGSSDATNVIRVLAITLLLSGIGSVPTALIQRRFQQGRQLTADVSSFVVGAVLTIVLIQAGFGAMSLAWSRVIGQLVAVITLFAMSRYRPRFGFDRAIVRDAARFGLPLVGANVLSWILLNMDYVVIGRTLGATSLGVYVLAFNMSSWPTTALSQALSGVALPAFSRSQDPDPAVQTGYLRAGVALTLAASVPFAVILLSVGGAVIEVVYGTRWAGAAGPVAVLATAGALRPAFVLFAVYLTARGATKSVFAVQLVWTGLLLPALVLLVHIGGIRGAGLAHLLVGVIIVLPLYLFALRRRGIDVWRLRCPVPIVAGVVAWAASRFAITFTSAALVDLLVGTGVAMAVYLALVGRWLMATVADFRGRYTLGEESDAAAGDEALSAVGADQTFVPNAPSLPDQTT